MRHRQLMPRMNISTLLRALCRIFSFGNTNCEKVGEN